MVCAQSKLRFMRSKLTGETYDSILIDESGQDHQDSPYEVHDGIAIRDSSLWD